MGRNQKETEVPSSTPERRSLRHAKPQEEEVKQSPVARGRKSVGKKKEEKAEKKPDEKKVEDKVDKKAEDKTRKKPEEKPEKDAEDENEEGFEEADDSKIDHSTSEPVAETSSAKPGRRSGRKRRQSEEIEPEEEANNEINKTDDTNDGKVTDEKDKGEKQDSVQLKNGNAEGSSKGKAKKERKPPTKKKKKEEQDESEMWTPLEPLDGEEKKDPQKKIQSKSDRRKQALIERQAPAEPMLQKQPPRPRRNSDGSECEVLVSVPRNQRRSRTIVTVDIDDEASETGSIQIVAEPDVDSVFDFKRLLIQYRNVNLPSSLWGVHKDSRNLFVSFTRFNPDFPDTEGFIVDRAVIFKGSLKPEAYVNGERLELPEMFTTVETIFEAAQVIEFVNNTVTPPIVHSPEPIEQLDVQSTIN